MHGADHRSRLTQSLGQLPAFGPVASMAGLGVAFASPVVVFTHFPDWKSRLPKPGGWFTTVKIILTFLWLAYSLEFLGNAALAYHWRWLDPKALLISRVVTFTLMIAVVLARVLMETERGKGILRVVLDDFDGVVVWDSIDCKTE